MQDNTVKMTFYCTEISEDDSDHDQDNQNLEYKDRRSQRGRGNRYDDILFRLRYS